MLTAQTKTIERDWHCTSSSLGGPPTGLKNMANCQEWKGQRLDQKHVLRKLLIKNCFIQYDAKYFLNFSIKEMIRLDLFNVGNVKYMASLF